MNISFRIPTLPIAQPRAKATTINGKARMYEAKKSHAIHTFKAAVQSAAYEAYQGPPLEDALCCELVFVFTSKSKRERKPKTTRPDCDNLGKGVLDALNGLLFKDDSQVVQLSIAKWHAAGDEQPHVEAIFYKLGD